MSERIINALVQLFALIAIPRNMDEVEGRRQIVYNFLCQQLNNDLAKEYLSKFDSQYNEYVKKRRESENQFKRHSAISAKVLRITNEINRDLSYYQKIIILVNLFEFLNINKGITSIEQSLINIISDSFNLKMDEFELIKDFILNYDSITEGVIFTSKTIKTFDIPKRTFWDDLDGDIHFIHIPTANVFLFKILAPSNVLLNGQNIISGRAYVMHPGSSLRNKLIAPIFYSDVMSNAVSSKFYTPITLEVRNVTYKFNNKTIGIQPISFESHSGKLVGIMGVSGSGKSTLTNVLSGMAEPQDGNVYINNIDIYKDSKSIKGLIGYVSQDDILIEDLTVYENLYYNAKLSFDNLTNSEIEIKVISTLKSLGLYTVKNMKVGSPLNKKISGGQRKRLNIALELIREPSILILDEPTSGLSSHDSENILELLKELSLKGKLIYVVIHQPSSDIFKMFDQLLILDTGGYLIYAGNPLESLAYFKSSLHIANRTENECRHCGNINVEQVLDIISLQLIDEYGNYLQTRKVSPKEWYDKFNWGHIDLHYVGEPEPLPKITFKTPNKLKQLYLYLCRDIKSKMSNIQYIVINMLEAPVLAILLASLLRFRAVDQYKSAYVFSDNPNIPIYMIIAVIIAFFIGLTVSAEEIINDRKILKREKFLDLSRLSYLCSKTILSMILSAIQMLTFVVVGNYIMGIKNMLFDYWMILFATSVSANLIGLVLSDSLKKSVNIYITIPFMVIPQLIFSGVFVNFDKMNPDLSSVHGVPVYGQMITARWAFEALITNQFMFNKYEEHFYKYDKIKSQTIFYKDYWVPTLQNHLEKVYKLTREGKVVDTRKNHFFTLIFNEIKSNTGKFPIDDPSNDLMCSSLFNQVSYEAISDYLDEVKSYNIKLYNKIDGLQDEYRKKMCKDDNKAIENLRKEHFNYAVEQIVKNKSSITSPMLVEYNDRIWQKADPIFMDTKYSITADLYSPYKHIQLLDIDIDTPIFNLIIIWLQNILLFVVLYTGIIGKCLNATLFKHRPH